MWQVGVQGRPCCAWHGSMPGNHAQVGLIRLFCGRSRAARTTFSLNAWSYVVRFFLVREPGVDEVGVGIGHLQAGCFVLLSRGPSGDEKKINTEAGEKGCTVPKRPSPPLIFTPPLPVRGQNGDDGQGKAAALSLPPVPPISPASWEEVPANQHQKSRPSAGSRGNIIVSRTLAIYLPLMRPKRVPHCQSAT